MRIGEAARRAGVNTETLRYYERRGLLPEPDRGIGGQREYGEETVRFVSAVKQAQTLGFSLREIEDFVRVARRDPRGAPEIIRRRLEEKLGRVEDEIADLRTTQAGLVRALDEVWASVPKSTSTAAYLVRAGRHPELRPGEPLHVADGESVASTLRRRTTLGGVVLAWQDVLHEGPLPAVPADELPAIRAAFLADQGWGEATAITEEMRRRDELLARAIEDAHPIVLWFEHDLFDQLQLLQILSAMPVTAGSVELVPTDDHLGPLTAAELEALWSTRRGVTRETIELGHTAWQAVCTNEIEPFLRRDTSSLPHLAPALRRLLQERGPLPRTDRQLLEALLDGPQRPLELFVANQAREEAAFLGDTWCFLRLYELSQRRLVAPSLPLPPPRGDRKAFTAIQLQLTPEGRELV